MKAKQDKGLKRDIIDKFYTKPEITEYCYNIIKHNLEIDYDSDIVIEPSAGNGSFLYIIKRLCKNYKLYDIDPDDNESIIEKQDYLLLNLNEYKDYNGKIHIIGNPPFGRQSSLAIKFIRKSALFCDSISFILPKSFKKDSLKKKIPLNFHCIYENDLPENSFLINNNEYNVPCIFQIWKKLDYNRLEKEKLIEKGYSFVKKEENPDISFRRVGVYAGKVDKEILDKSIQSHYFIKFDKFTDELYEKIKALEFKESNNTVGPRSISKQELIIEFNPVICK